MRIERLRDDPDLARDTAAPRYKQTGVTLKDIDLERIAGPPYRAGANFKILFCASNTGAWTLRHDPATAWPIKRHIKARVINRITASGALVIGREHTAQKRDNRQPVLPVVADCIDVPPGIGAGYERRIEAWSDWIVSAASIPDKAAIGTPADG